MRALVISEAHVATMSPPVHRFGAPHYCGSSRYKAGPGFEVCTAGVLCESGRFGESTALRRPSVTVVIGPLRLLPG
jgi:hypothetical protein